MAEFPTLDTMDLLFPFTATTGTVTVRVAVSYLEEQSNPADQRWFFSYHIRIENHGDDTIQLLGRHWTIVDALGSENEVIGEGVVGDLPVIEAGESYDYVSGCPLPTPSGYMEGRYQMIDANGDGFEIRIPRFDLTGPRQ